MAEVKQLRDYQVDERMDIFVLLKEVDPRVTQQGKRYLAVSVADRSMEIRGMKWDATQEEADTLQAGMVIFMAAVRQVYQDKPQLKILSMRPTRVGEPQDPSDFMNAAPMKASEMEEEVSALIFQITNATWQRIVRHLLSKYHDEFYKYPAAKSNHHAFAGGLGFHSLSIARLAQAIVKQYPGVNASLLYAGALLHDLGKVIELTGPIATQYTTAGNLIGHIVLIDEQIVLAANELHLDLYSEDMLVLRHTVLAHHGLMEYGSPVRPLIKEANILHQLDELDANMQSFDNALAETEPGEFSQRQWALDNRNVYKPDLK
ncbi:HD domain-containing protein [Weissella cibaria]|uniref:3'-5' exoribonuclease YhaM family protein n=1 Tax=Weissella cibaria TaxID=137591 RepID=UPI001F331634|nr:HD domain-containing protein [Weissella cibaria]UJF02985.1 HD domain-containing protein [Weissella cibaria]